MLKSIEIAEKYQGQRKEKDSSTIKNWKPKNWKDGTLA